MEEERITSRGGCGSGGERDLLGGWKEALGSIGGGGGPGMRWEKVMEVDEIGGRGYSRLKWVRRIL